MTVLAGAPSRRQASRPTTALDTRPWWLTDMRGLTAGRPQVAELRAAPTALLDHGSGDLEVFPDELLELELELELPGLPPESWQHRPEDPPPSDKPLALRGGNTRSDKIFRHGVRVIGITVLWITGGIGLFLALHSIPTFRHYGFGYLTGAKWNPSQQELGIAGMLVGTFEVALVAMTFAFPVALLTALYISEYAPAWARSWFVSVIDLMAAVPSIVWGLWGRDLMEPHLILIERWLSEYFGWIPIFKASTDSHAALWQQTQFTGSGFIAGVAVAMMTMPMACAMMRQVFSQTPQGEKEAALALGATRWEVVRAVVLPFGRGGIIGGTMLALGRALGETIAVVLIISPKFGLGFHPLQNGVATISATIAGRFSEADKNQLDALLTAGFVLFLITLVVNSVAGIIVNRSRSGAGTDI
jgi:phosphate transport system permease protein